MKIGKVKFYNETKGFGFIESSDGENIFFHRSGLSDAYLELESGQAVEFQTRKGDKGLVAFAVKLSY
ncbi:MAG: cold shock domain-containing protein [Bacteroidales bacterium]|nr:cold shock domain-containing protein [Bacteroidales bacterium]MCF8403378.1 cold shock domain-containing protein [Bacteroidales bacterium]